MQDLFKFFSSGLFGKQITFSELKKVLQHYLGMPLSNNSSILFSLQTVYISTAQPQYLEVLRSRHFFSCCQRKNLPKQIQLSFSTYFFKIYLNFLKRKHRKTSWLFFQSNGAFLIHPNFDITNHDIVNKSQLPSYFSPYMVLMIQ